MAMTDPTTTPLIDPAAPQSPQIKQPVAGPTGTPLPVAGPQTQPTPIATPGGSQVPPNSPTALPVAPAQTYDPTSPYAQQTGVPANLPGGGAPGSGTPGTTQALIGALPVAGPGALPPISTPGGSQVPPNSPSTLPAQRPGPDASRQQLLDYFKSQGPAPVGTPWWMGADGMPLSETERGAYLQSNWSPEFARANGLASKDGFVPDWTDTREHFNTAGVADDPTGIFRTQAAGGGYAAGSDTADGRYFAANPLNLDGTPKSDGAALPVAGAPAQNAGTLPAGTGGGGQPAPQSAIERALAGGASGGTSGNSSLPVAGPSSSSSGPGSLSLTDQDLTGSTLGVGPTADRMKLIQDELKNFDAEQDPVRAAQQRQLTQQAAGLGRVGSGALRTDIGNLDLAGENSRNQKISDLISGATDATISDRYRDVGIAQQQQGRQDSQQGVAFNQAAQQAALQEALTSGDFNRYMQLLQAGNQGNPSDTALSLANSYNQEAGQAGNAAGQLISNSVGNQNNGSIPPYLQQILQQYLGNGGSATPKAAANGPLPMTE